MNVEFIAVIFTTHPLTTEELERRGAPVAVEFGYIYDVVDVPVEVNVIVTGYVLFEGLKVPTLAIGVPLIETG